MSRSIAADRHRLLGEMYREAARRATDARKTTQQLQAAGTRARLLGSKTAQEADHEDIVARQAEDALNIAYTIIAAGLAMAGGGQGGGGAAAQSATSVAQSVLSNMGLLGSVIQAAIEGAQSGGFTGALMAIGEAMLKQAGPLSKVLDLAAGQSGSSEQRLEGVRSAVAGELVSLAQQTMRALPQAKRDEAEAFDRLSGALRQAEADARKAEKLALAERREIEGHLLQLKRTESPA